MEHEWHAGELGDRVASDVVLGRPEPSADEHHVGARRREPQRLDDPPLVVADGLVMGDVDADRSELLGHPLGVGVGDLAEQQLGADRQDVSSHSSTPATLAARCPIPR